MLRRIAIVEVCALIAMALVLACSGRDPAPDHRRIDLPAVPANVTPESCFVWECIGPDGDILETYPTGPACQSSCSCQTFGTLCYYAIDAGGDSGAGSGTYDGYVCRSEACAPLR